MRLLSCERDVPLAKPMPPGLRLVPATSQRSCVRAFWPATLMPRDLQPALATPRLSYGRLSSPEKQKLQGYWLGLAKSQLSSYGPF
jgi:hypothetical protein